MAVAEVQRRVPREAVEIAVALDVGDPRALAAGDEGLGELRGLGPIAVHCQGGSRSAVAASVLRSAGFADVVNVDGGYSAWLRAGNSPMTGA